MLQVIRSMHWIKRTIGLEFLSTTLVIYSRILLASKSAHWTPLSIQFMSTKYLPIRLVHTDIVFKSYNSY